MPKGNKEFTMPAKPKARPHDVIGFVGPKTVFVVPYDGTGMDEDELDKMRGITSRRMTLHSTLLDEVEHTSNNGKGRKNLMLRLCGPTQQIKQSRTAKAFVVKTGDNDFLACFQFDAVVMKDELGKHRLSVVVYAVKKNQEAGKVFVLRERKPTKTDKQPFQKRVVNPKDIIACYGYADPGMTQDQKTAFGRLKSKVKEVMEENNVVIAKTVSKKAVPKTAVSKKAVSKKNVLKKPVQDQVAEQSSASLATTPPPPTTSTSASAKVAADAAATGTSVVVAAAAASSAVVAAVAAAAAATATATAAAAAAAATATATAAAADALSPPELPPVGPTVLAPRQATATAPAPQ